MEDGEEVPRPLTSRVGHGRFLLRVEIRDGHSFEGLITGKGDKERVVFFDEAALVAIGAYLTARLDPYEPVFLRHDDGRGKPGPRGEHCRLSPQSVWGGVKKYGALAGVEVTTHHLRHRKARVMLNNGAQLSEVQDILGHASPETTEKIDAPSTKQHLRDAFDRFSLSADKVAHRVRRSVCSPVRLAFRCRHRYPRAARGGETTLERASCPFDSVLARISRSVDAGDLQERSLS
jgi:hypothetical protein